MGSNGYVYSTGWWNIRRIANNTRGFPIKVIHKRPARAVAIAKITNNRAGYQVTQTMVLEKKTKVLYHDGNPKR